MEPNLIGDVETAGTDKSVLPIIRVPKGQNC